MNTAIRSEGCGKCSQRCIFTRPARVSVELCFAVMIDEVLITFIAGDTLDPVGDQMMRQDPGFTSFHSIYLNEIANFEIQIHLLEVKKES